MAVKSFDVEAFNRAYQDELPVNVERVNKNLTAAHAKMGLMTPTLTSVGDVQSTVCDAWPKIRKVVNTLLKFSWLVPGASAIAPMVKAFMAALDKAVMPALCGKQPTEPPVV